MHECALLFADLVDSTLMVEQLGDVRATELWSEHDRRARDLIARHRGREIDRADGFFLLFDACLEAARFALAYQEILEDLGIRARIGLHVGPVALRHNAVDDVRRGAKPIEVEGLAKPVAARVMALAGGRQILLSAAARQALDAELPEGAEIASHGHYRLKGVEAPLEIFELGVSRLCSFLPPTDSDKAYRVVQFDDLWRPLREVHQNLPAERDTFIGRTVELRALSKRLESGVRLLTVVGPAGSGKTRLVCRYGHAWLGDWPGGVYFCDLTDARSLDGIYFVVAATLGITLGGADHGTQIGHAIASRGRCLVILDNFEQLVTHGESTVGRWVDRAAAATFVVTSREVLHLRGEGLYPLDPLDVESDAVDLFVVRARAQRPDFMLDVANRPDVIEVVRLLDGLPLAIELAAARVRAFSPAQLVRRMRDRFRILSGSRSTAARQATLATAIDWSWGLLKPCEQAALAQCSVFEGGFTMEAAEAVLDLSPWPEAPDVVSVVQALLDKSLLRTWVPVQHSRFDIDEPFFGMYLSIHEYAAAKLDAMGSGVADPSRVRHGEYFASFGTDASIQAIFQHGGAKRLYELSLEIDNLVCACRRATVASRGETAVWTYRAAWGALQLRGPFALAVDLGNEVLALGDIPPLLLAAVYETRGLALTRVGRTEEAVTQFSLAAVMFREHGSTTREGRALRGLAEAERQLGRINDARAHCEQALAIHRAAGDRVEEGGDLLNLGGICLEQGALDDSRSRYDAALVILREAGDRLNEAIVLGNLGNVDFDSGHMESARSHYEAAIAIERELDNRSYEGFYLNNLANLHHEQGRLEQALPLYLQSLEIAREVGDRRNEGRVLGNLAYLYGQQGRMAECESNCDAALLANREVGNRRSEAIVLENLGVLREEQRRWADALQFFEQALAIHRELGNGIGEANTLSNIASVDHEQGRLSSASAGFVKALAIHRALGHHLGIGTDLSGFAALLLQQDQLDAAKAALLEAEALLREVHHPLRLARLLAVRGRVEVAEGRRDRAVLTLAEAREIAAAIGAASDSRLGRQIDALHDSLATPSGGLERGCRPH